MDVTEANFQSAVIERSRQLPVVVDFWADWCGPCRQLGPVLERAVAARGGKVELTKLDVDSNQRLASQFRVQGIPAVKAFRDGRVVAEFVGAQPPPAVERFLDSLLPSDADGLVQRGDEESLRRAVELEPTRADAVVPLARILHARGESDEALQLLGRVSGSVGAAGRGASHSPGTSSGSAPIRDAATGRPAAMASAAASPKVSAERDGTTPTAAPRRSFRNWSSSTRPANVTPSARASSRARSGPSPAITSGRPASWQASIATSIPFSGASRVASRA